MSHKMKTQGRQYGKSLEALIAETRASIEFKQKWNTEHPGEVNEMRMHYLDGRLEDLEEVLQNISPPPPEPSDSKAGLKVLDHYHRESCFLDLPIIQFAPCLIPGMGDDVEYFALSFEDHLMGSMIHFHIRRVGEEARELNLRPYHSYLLANAPEWARKLVKSSQGTRKLGASPALGAPYGKGSKP